MADLSTHYKERSPEETIQIVRNFFESHGLRMEISDLNESEAGTWYCKVSIYLGDICLYSSNGKGVNKTYAMASGEAEAYERLCNGSIFMSNPYFSRSLIDYNKEHYGYHFRKDEKVLTYQEVVNSSVKVQHFLCDVGCMIEPLTKAMVNYMTNGVYVGIPFKNIDSNDTDNKYIDPRILCCTTRSIGMTAGNTVEEALVQGLSETLEKEYKDEFFHHMSESYHALKLENIQDETLQTIIKNIQDAGYELYLIDLSYNYDVPVMMSLIVNRDTGVLNMNFGAFPVFNIAAERVLTELYQGIKSYNIDFFTKRFQIPYKSFADVNRLYGNAIDGSYFSAEFFKGLQFEDSYNKKVYVDKDKTNKELIQYFIDIATKTNTKFYYCNNSLSEDMVALWVLRDNEKYYTTIDYMWDDIKVLQCIDLLKSFTKLFNEIYTDSSSVSYNNLIRLIIQYNDSFVKSILGYVMLWHYLFLGLDNNSFSALVPLIDGSVDPMTIMNIFSNSVCKKEFKKYIQLRKYVNTGFYTEDELMYIFNTIFNYKITSEDIKCCQSNTLILKKVYVEPLHNYIHSEEYKKFIQMFAQGILHNI